MNAFSHGYLHTKRFHCFIEGSSFPADVTDGKMATACGPKNSENSRPMPNKPISHGSVGLYGPVSITTATYSYNGLEFFTVIFSDILQKLFYLFTN